ncbi:MAG: hypothetical protein PHU04_03615 [Candidatus Peribacteraceae bacterium]|nr:hypothetical protein [Candidatus Peribacteraceae bacterium]
MPIIIPVKAVIDGIGYGRTVNQLIDLFVKTEMEKRGVKGFKAAVIEMFDDSRSPIVHLDDDVVFQFEFKEEGIANASDVGKVKSINLKDVKNIKAIEDSLDPNSAKCYIIQWGKPHTTDWILSYDFRYNKKVAKEKLNRAREFIAACNKLDTSRSFHVLVYLLWSALELILDVRLWLLPNHKPTEEHRDRRIKLERLSKTSGLLSPEFCKAFKCFSQHKDSARYAIGEVRKTKKFNEQRITDTISLLEGELNEDPYLQF